LQVQQAQMLRQTMLALTNALAVTQANQVSGQAQGIATLQQFFAGPIPHVQSGPSPSWGIGGLP
jgi:hypothetical protein